MKFNAMDKYFFHIIESKIKVAGMIQRLVNARVGIGHGQMEGRGN
jgi:hypothetical protein